MNNQRRQLEKESAVRLELEGKIMTHMQQKLTHKEAAKYSQRLTAKTATLKKDKVTKDGRNIQKVSGWESFKKIKMPFH